MAFIDTLLHEYDREMGTTRLLLEEVENISVVIYSKTIGQRVQERQESLGNFSRLDTGRAHSGEGRRSRLPRYGTRPGPTLHVPAMC